MKSYLAQEDTKSWVPLNAWLESGALPEPAKSPDSEPERLAEIS